MYYTFGSVLCSGVVLPAVGQVNIDGLGLFGRWLGGGVNVLIIRWPLLTSLHLRLLIQTGLQEVHVHCTHTIPIHCMVSGKS